VYVNGDYFLITFNETTDRASLRSALYSTPSACALAGTCSTGDATTILGPSTILNRTVVDNMFNFSHALGRDYRGQWISEQIFRLTVIDARGHGNPPIGVFRISCKYTGAIRNEAQTSLYSYRGSLSPPLIGSWGTAPAGYLFGSTNKVVEVDMLSASLNVTLLPVALQSIDFNDFPMTDLAVGANHAISIANGVVYGVGANDVGQLGLSTTLISTVTSAYPTYSRYTLVPSIVGLDSINNLLIAAGGLLATDVAAGSGHSLVLADNGAVYGSGLNFYGQLASTPPVGTLKTAFRSTFQALSVGVTVTGVGAGDDFSLFIASSGQIYTCGLHFGAVYTSKGYTSTPTLVTGLTGKTVSEVSGGYDHALALVNGTVYAWGRNAEGQLGLGSSAADTVASPTIITSLMGNFIVHISAGGFHSLAVDSKGTVFCWGANANGECGMLPSVKRLDTPYELAITSLGNSLASKVSAGAVTSLVSTANGEVYAMGWNVNGVLGVAVSQTDVPLRATGGNDSFIALVGAGSTMSMAATRSASSACPYDCFGHGGCYLGTCQCSDLWIGDDCSIPRCPLYNGTECAGNGTCLVVADLPTCFCNTGYGGEACTEPDCSISPYNNCTFNGNCTWLWEAVYPPYDPLNPNAIRIGVPTLTPACICDAGYGQPNCSYCDQGWSGDHCDVIDCGFLNNCTDHGSCIATGSVVSCNCSTGWTGNDCSFPYCPGTPSCSGHGTCLYREANITANITKGPFCQCDQYYGGIDCSNHTYTCLGTPQCSGHGNCTFLAGYTAPKCICYDHWHTQTCSEPLCDHLNQCSGRGSCVSLLGAPACSCQDQWTGSTCSEEDSSRTTLIILLVVGVVIVGAVVTIVICYGMYKRSKKGGLHAHRNNFFSSIQQRRQAFQGASMR
jgi:alpha-tubulin suppressor-like RCC1 family protein